jgi:hypothetical protein
MWHGARGLQGLQEKEEIVDGVGQEKYTRDRRDRKFGESRKLRRSSGGILFSPHVGRRHVKLREAAHDLFVAVGAPQHVTF